MSKLRSAFVSRIQRVALSVYVHCRLCPRKICSSQALTKEFNFDLALNNSDSIINEVLAPTIFDEAPNELFTIWDSDSAIHYPFDSRLVEYRPLV
jgi:hypothetical protein